MVMPINSWKAAGRCTDHGDPGNVDSQWKNPRRSRRRFGLRRKMPRTSSERWAVLREANERLLVAGVRMHELHLTGVEGTRLSGEVETVLYRAMQEALNNVAKHADAKNVELELKHGPVETVLNIADDGAGFDLKRQHRDGRKHFGLDGMRERAALVRGTVRVEGRPGDGTAVTVRIPVSGAG